jgi:hypothetical protein
LLGIGIPAFIQANIGQISNPDKLTALSALAYTVESRDNVFERKLKISTLQRSTEFLNLYIEFSSDDKIRTEIFKVILEPQEDINGYSEILNVPGFASSFLININGVESERQKLSREPNSEMALGYYVKDRFWSGFFAVFG